MICWHSVLSGYLNPVSDEVSLPMWKRHWLPTVFLNKSPSDQCAPPTEKTCQLYNSAVAIRASGNDGAHNFALEAPCILLHRFSATTQDPKSNCELNSYKIYKPAEDLFFQNCLSCFFSVATLSLCSPTFLTMKIRTYGWSEKDMQPHNNTVTSKGQTRELFKLPSKNVLQKWSYLWFWELEGNSRS